MIQAKGLTKAYGKTLAVDDLSFTVESGHVTGFLGPNGAGKSTTLRMVMGLDNPTAGSVTVGGRPLGQHKRPLFEIGALLDAKAYHPGRSAYNHLLALAESNGIKRSRIEEVLDIVGLSDVAGRRAGSFSMGMGQRLGIAAALLGDPGVLIFDEPVNGLDPEGIVWVRNLMRSLAAQGRAVFVSSHLMSEMALTADHLVVIGRGKLIADASVEDLVSGSAASHVRVRTPHPETLSSLISAHGGRVRSSDDGALMVDGLQAPAIGDLAAANGVALHELVAQNASLEEAFMELTRDSVEFQSHDTSIATGSGK